MTEKIVNEEDTWYLNAEMALPNPEFYKNCYNLYKLWGEKKEQPQE